MTWTRPLTPEEGRADLEADEVDISLAFRGGPPDPAAHDLGVRENVLPSGPVHGWQPILPGSVPQCPVCTLPRRENRLCSRCRRLQDLLGTPVDTLEFLAICDKRSNPENRYWPWKDEAHQLGVGATCSDDLPQSAAALSAYVESHGDRLLAGSPLITAVPSRAPLISNAFAIAKARGWFAVEVVESGRKVGDWAQHTSTQAERLSRTSSDWVIDPAVVRARAVLLFDDVFVTGTSMFSYARALRAAGASKILAVSVVRHVDGRNRDYSDARRIVRRSQRWDWSPDRESVATF